MRLVVGGGESKEEKKKKRSTHSTTFFPWRRRKASVPIFLLNFARCPLATFLSSHAAAVRRQLPEPATSPWGLEPLPAYSPTKPAYSPDGGGGS